MKFLLFVVLVAAVQAQSLFEWESFPYDNRDFNVQAEYGDDLTLVCNDTRLYEAGDFQVKKWILPDLQIMYPNDTIIFRSLDALSGWAVSSDGIEVDITLVQQEHFGPYLCVVDLADGSELAVKVGINMWGPDYGDTWQKYKDAIIWACSLTLAFIVACVVSFVFYTKNESPEIFPEEEEDEVAASKAGLSNGKVYENAAFTQSNGNLHTKIEESITSEVETSAL